MKLRRTVATVILLACAAAYAQKHRDPLTVEEVDKVRETTQEPEKRIPLYLQFAKARLLAVEQVRADNKLGKDRGKQIHDLLEDFASITDELERNLDMFERQHEDMRKPLKAMVETYTDWQLRLRSIKEAPGVSDEEKKAYDFPLQSAIDSVNGGLDDARDLLERQNRDFKDKKKK